MTMERENMGESTLEKAKLIIKGLKGVLNIQKLSDEDRKILMEIESDRDGDIIPVINKGLGECLNREFCLILLKDENFRIAPAPTVLLVTDKGRILGQELLSPKEKEIYHDRGDVYFLSDNFVLFKPDKTLDRTLNEKEFFVLPPIPFPELEELEEVSEVTSCSPSALGDNYLKVKYNYPQDPSIATIIVCFSIKKE